MFLRRLIFISPLRCRSCHLPSINAAIPEKPSDVMDGEFGNLLNDLEKAYEPEKPLTEAGGATELDEYAPYTMPSFSLAAYANKSVTIKKFIELGVDLHKIEKRKRMGQFVLRLDFERDCTQHLLFLKDIGVMPEKFGRFITKNPLIFKESLDDLGVRVNYLQSKGFRHNMISRVVSVNPFWLMFTTKRIDRRLGHFQKTFQLTGNQVRSIATLEPNLITYNMEHIIGATFSVKEEMGFDKDEIKSILLQVPKVFMMNHEEILKRFEFIHHKMKISHQDMLQSPELFLTRQFKLRQRHMFLEKLGRNQYDPVQPLYIPLSELCTATNEEFVEKLAKSSMAEYEAYLKTL